MNSDLSRRLFLSALLGSVGHFAYAGAPSSSERPVARGEARTPVDRGAVPKVDVSALRGQVGYAVVDIESGELVDARLPDVRLPPASTMKAITALYALDRLGPDHVFRTRVLGTGPVVNGRLEGDLVLMGGGDPTLDTDRLATLAVALREQGIIEVQGRFLVWADALPRDDRIDDDQPDQVGYNPSFGGLNLNFNRVHFEWKRNGDGYETTMQARALKFRPGSGVAQMAIVERKTPVFEYRGRDGLDRWTVAKGALGKEGARWLPVRYPALYAADAFRTLARSNGIVLKPAEIVSDLPEGRLLALSESEKLTPMLRDMLKYSTNLTAEAVGLASSLSNGVPIDGLLASGSRMAGWATSQFGVRDMRFRDHSGLGYGSDVAAPDMARILAANPHLAPLLKPVNLNLGKDLPAPEGVSVFAKTGTLNFVSSLAGFLTTRQGRDLSFAIFMADRERRDSIPPALRERPPGAKGWANRSRRMQKDLLRDWAVRYDT